MKIKFSLKRYLIGMKVSPQKDILFLANEFSSLDN